MRFRLLLVVIPLILGACHRVAPYQRETLSHRTMQAQPDEAEDKLDNHVTEYREGSLSGTGVGGGGCGCN